MSVGRTTVRLLCRLINLLTLFLPFVFLGTFLFTTYFLSRVGHAVWVATWASQIVCLEAIGILIVIRWHTRSAAVAMIAASMNLVGLFSVGNLIRVGRPVALAGSFDDVVMTIPSVSRRSYGNYEAARAYIWLDDASSIPGVQVLVHKYVGLWWLRRSHVLTRQRRSAVRAVHVIGNVVLFRVGYYIRRRGLLFLRR